MNKKKKQEPRSPRTDNHYSPSMFIPFPDEEPPRIFGSPVKRYIKIDSNLI